VVVGARPQGPKNRLLYKVYLASFKSVKARTADRLFKLNHLLNLVKREPNDFAGRKFLYKIAPSFAFPTTKERPPTLRI
jgi:hypothetical protein